MAPNFAVSYSLSPFFLFISLRNMPSPVTIKVLNQHRLLIQRFGRSIYGIRVNLARHPQQRHLQPPTRSPQDLSLLQRQIRWYDHSERFVFIREIYPDTRMTTYEYLSVDHHWSYRHQPNNCDYHHYQLCNDVHDYIRY